MTILGLAAFGIGLSVRTWRGALVVAAVIAALFLAWNLAVLVAVVASTPVADPAGGLAQAGGYVTGKVLIGAAVFLVAAVLGQDLRRVAADRRM